MKPVNFVWCLAYLIIAFYIATRWARGLLPIAAALAILLLIMVVIAGHRRRPGRAGSIATTPASPAPSRCSAAAGSAPDTLGLVHAL